MSGHGKKHLFRGAMAGVAGGLVASWVMNEFIEGPGKKLQESVQDGRPEQKSQDDDATMKMADAVVEFTTGGRHLSHQGKEKGGPIVHYSYGALAGGFYGALAEFWEAPKAGLGSILGIVLFGAGDLVAVPALHLSASPTDESPSDLLSPFLSHVVYGVTAEVSRRAIRSLL
jgi:uncharacterized membrane protein YagU involved in acid resistance